jgi:Zn-dependent peptidase ImmA (M78 family)
MEAYIDYIAKGILDIDTPDWIEVKILDTDTQIAAADIKKNIIYTKKGTDEKMLFFAIAHELRHMWQAKNKKDFLIKFDKSKKDIKCYNEQEAEVDANAFAAAIMMLMFGIRPLFKTLGEETREKIYVQTEIIMDELEQEY